jgi:Fe-S oxidoreductase
VGALKAEFLYHTKRRMVFSRNFFANNAKLNKLGSVFPALTNFMVNQPLVKKRNGCRFKREVPLLAQKTFRKWIESNKSRTASYANGNSIFCDEFTNYYDVSVGIDALNYYLNWDMKVVVDHEESGRAYISKGFLKKQKDC